MDGICRIFSHQLYLRLSECIDACPAVLYACKYIRNSIIITVHLIYSHFKIISKGLIYVAEVYVPEFIGIILYLMMKLRYFS